MDELDKVRDRDYPKRCRKCYLITNLCVCTKEYGIPVPKSGVRVRSVDRIRQAAWN